MSTSTSQPNPEASWKQEVNRRLAAHRSRRGSVASEPDQPAETRRSASSRAAQAAARVAARYATAPSFSEMLAIDESASPSEPAAVASIDHVMWHSNSTEEAEPIAVKLADQPMWDSNMTDEAEPATVEAAPAVSAAWEPEMSLNAFREPEVLSLSETPFEPIQPIAALSQPSFEAQPEESKWEPEQESYQAEPEAAPAPRADQSLETAFTNWFQESYPELDPQVEAVEPDESADANRANLIEFPREAGERKTRARQAHGHTSTDVHDGQLSIFEVDPHAHSPQHTPEPQFARSGTDDSVTMPAWLGAEWQEMELDLPEPEPTSDAPDFTPPAIQPASVSRRLLAAVVDGALIAVAFMAAAYLAMANMDRPLPGKLIETGAVTAFLAIALLYQMFFYTLAEATPGMRYARLSLCTFSDEYPTCARRYRRLGALLLSLLPAGLGVAWAFFDEQHLSWHDRLSGTYQRKSY